MGPVPAIDALIAQLWRLADRTGADRVRLARELSDVAMGTLAAIADEEVWRLTRDASRREVAQVLGVSEAAIGKAVRQHNARQKAATRSTETDRPKRVRRAKAS